MLRHPIVRRVEEEVPNVVPKVVGLPSDPSREVVPEVLAHTRHVLHDERRRLRMSYHGEKILVEEVSTRVPDAAAPNPLFLGKEARLFRTTDSGESLTWRASDHDGWTRRKHVEEVGDRQLVHVALLRPPEHNKVLFLEEGLGEGIRCGLVVLDSPYTFPSSSMKPEGHTSGAGEQVENGRGQRLCSGVVEEPCA